MYVCMYVCVWVLLVFLHTHMHVSCLTTWDIFYTAHRNEYESGKDTFEMLLPHYMDEASLNALLARQSSGHPSTAS